MNDKTSQNEAPQTDDLGAIEQWHENQEAEARKSIAFTGAVGIECQHGYEACPKCDEVKR